MTHVRTPAQHRAWLPATHSTREAHFGFLLVCSVCHVCRHTDQSLWCVTHHLYLGQGGAHSRGAGPTVRGSALRRGEGGEGRGGEGRGGRGGRGGEGRKGREGRGGEGGEGRGGEGRKGRGGEEGRGGEGKGGEWREDERCGGGGRKRWGEGG